MSNRWGWGKIALLCAGGFVAAGFFMNEFDPTAQSCLATRENKGWSQLYFYNSCRKPINVLFCQKRTLGEIGKWFGYKTGEWDCRHHHVQPGKQFKTLIWTNRNSSGLAFAASSSRYAAAACKSGYKPRFTKGTKFTCNKR